MQYQPGQQPGQASVRRYVGGYIPMRRGFVYLADVIDWRTRRVLPWRILIIMEVAFCFEAVKEAMAQHGKLEIFNTDQESHFTGAASTGLLANSQLQQKRRESLLKITFFERKFQRRGFSRGVRNCRRPFVVTVMVAAVFRAAFIWQPVGVM